MPAFIPAGLLVLLSAVAGLAQAESLFHTRYDGVPEAAQQQFERATRIWERYLDTDVPIRVRVSWVERGPTAFAVPRGVRNAPHLPVANVWYPSALASSLAGERDSEQDDINIFFLAGENWYYGGDTAIAAEQMDFLSVALHEIAHGLGMSSGSFVPWDGSGGASLGLPNDFVSFFSLSFLLGPLDGTPQLYDSRVIDGGGVSLVEVATAGNPSPALTAYLAREDLVFNGVQAREANAGRAPRLAPGNVAHFSVDDNPPGSGNYLMTPSSGDGRFSHEPGPLLVAVLQDLGWKVRRQ